MSSRRVMATCAFMWAIAASGGWAGGSALPPAPDRGRSAAGAQAPPRDPRPGDVRPASRRERDLEARLATEPTVNGYLELARLQQARGALDRAESTLTNGMVAAPDGRLLASALSALYGDRGRFEDAARVLEGIAADESSGAAAQQRVAALYEQTVRLHPSLADAAKARFIAAGLAAGERALAIDPEYVDAIAIKSRLVQYQSALEDEPLRTQLAAEAETLKQRAFDVRRQQVAARTDAGPRDANTALSAPPDPLHPFRDLTVNGVAAVRVGGSVKPPIKVRDVRPVYPPDALEAKVQGVVILEIVVDTDGAVNDARIVRSVPLLDAAAETAVRQWTFIPTVGAASPVPVIMTVTVGFTLP